MNDAAAKEALKDLVDANRSTLLQDLISQGEAREIAHLTTSILTPPVAYYFVGIHVQEAQEHSKSGANMQRPPRKASYDAMILIGDYATGVAGEDELYETVHRVFDRFVNRIGSLIEAQTWIGVSPRFRLAKSIVEADDRLIRRSNAQQMWFDEAEQYHAMLSSQLTFRLEDACVDDAQLYS